MERFVAQFFGRIDQHEDEDADHDGGQNLLKEAVINIHRPAGTEVAACQGGYGAQQRQPGGQHLFLAETADGGDALAQDSDAIGAVGDAGRQAEKDQHRQGQQ